MIYTAILVLSVVAGYQCATFYSCGWVTGPFIDCDRFSPEPTCGTDIKTYANKCEFSQAHCASPGLDLLHNGSCTDADVGNKLPIAGAEAVFDFFCTSLSKDPCPAEIQKVCGSDGRTYDNYCEYEKAKCTHRDMTVISFGELYQCATFYSCDWVTNSFIDCDQFTPEPTCGTDIKTYANKCEFSQAHCASPGLDLLHNGSCTDADVGNKLPIAGAEAVFDFFCTSLSKDPCPTEIQKVCGSDGRTYDNYCEYEKAKCTHRDMTVISFGECVPTTPASSP